MSDTARTPATGIETVHEAYSFACMRCGHAWEQAYEIEHHVDAEGRTVVAYRADGRAVPSPLTRPSCDNCDGHLVRIMRAGLVSAVSSGSGGARRGRGRATEEPASPDGAAGQRSADGKRPRHHWSLAGVLRHLHPAAHRGSGPAA
ncbi:hypothetical protein GCM10027168_34220 [Streptomyces capparidis]